MKKLSFYLTESVLDIYCDHMPLRKFLTGTTRCDKVNNWAIELQSFRAKINFIQGKKNTLADTMSRLVKLGIAEIDEQEPEGFEFGYQLFGEVDEINEITIPPPLNTPQMTLLTRQTPQILLQPLPFLLKPSPQPKCRSCKPKTKHVRESNELS